MSNNPIVINITGLNNVMRALSNMADSSMVGDLERISETYARKMAQESSDLAPIKDGALRGSLASSPERSDVAEHVWEYGSDLPYAVKMEYTHPTNKAFIRKVVWDNRAKYRKAIKERILRS